MQLSPPAAPACSAPARAPSSTCSTRPPAGRPGGPPATWTWCAGAGTCSRSDSRPGMPVRLADPGTGAARVSWPAGARRSSARPARRSCCAGRVGRPQRVRVVLRRPGPGATARRDRPGALSECIADDAHVICRGDGDGPADLGVPGLSRGGRSTSVTGRADRPRRDARRPRRPGRAAGHRPPCPTGRCSAASRCCWSRCSAAPSHPGLAARRPCSRPGWATTPLVSGDQLFLVGSGRLETGEPVRYRAITVYRLPDLARSARTTVTVPGSVTQVVPAGAALLVGYQIERDRLPGRHGDGGRHRPAALAAQRPAGRCLTGRRHRAAQRRARALRGRPGHRRAALDRPASRRRLSHRGGRWTGEFMRWLVVVTDSGRLEVRDARTGRPVATARVSRRGGRANGMIWPTGDLLLVDTGCRLRRLSPARPDPALAHRGRPVGELDAGRLRAGYLHLPPAARHDRAGPGDRARAVAFRPLGVRRAGRPLPAGHRRTTRWAATPSVSVIDPGTGAALGDFGEWQALGPAGDGTVYGTRSYSGPPGRYRTLYGLLDPATRHVRVLGDGRRRLRRLPDRRRSADLPADRRLGRRLAAWVAFSPLRPLHTRRARL